MKISSKEYTEEVIKRCMQSSGYLFNYSIVDDEFIALEINTNSESAYSECELLKDLEDMKIRISLEKNFSPIREMIVKKALS